MPPPDTAVTDAAAATPRWHDRPTDEVLRQLDAGPDGLSAGEAAGRLERDGPNRLPQPPRQSAWRRLLMQFHNVLIYILLVAAVGTAVLEHWVDTGVILGVVIINALIGFAQEGKAERALDAIRGMLSPKAAVLRDGQRVTVDAETLVAGDVVLLRGGDRVPADLRILEARNLRIDEAMLTGESAPVNKQAEPVDADAALGDRASLAFSGTLVAFGRGRGVVVATAAATEIGQVSAMLTDVQRLTTPLLAQVAQFGRWLSAVIVAVALLTFAFGLWVRDYAAMDMFLAAVSIAVAAIPEGLPAIMTITLALGVQQMARRNAIIRRLPAVETLGSVTTICSDKTGTLTRNEMTVQTVVTAGATYRISGVGYAPTGEFRRDGDGDGQKLSPDEEPVLAALLRAGLLCNEAAVREQDGRWLLHGEPTEGALVTAALKAGIDQAALEREWPRADSIPFDSAHKYMVTLHLHENGRALVAMKGAPETVMDACTHQRTPDGDEPLEADHWLRAMERTAAEGQRLLAVAVREPEDAPQRLGDDAVGGMVLLGVVGIIDPPREEAIRAVACCQAAGIRIKMITGDHAATAHAIAGQLGLETRGEPVTGSALQAMDDAELAEAVGGTDVFARTTPEHKLRLVKALQSRREVVAMTGDGVNDAPALKRADVGVAMGIKGTEAAKEASEMVLADDNFASIAHAVEEGRAVYDNLKKAILFILPTNGGQALTIMAAILLGLSLPLTPVQVLWVNMVTAVTLALALAFEPPEPGIMERPPRPPRTPLLSGFLIWRIGFVSTLLLAGTFGHYLWMIELQGASETLARTVAINTLVAGQVFYLFNSRFVLEPSWGARGFVGNRAVLVAVAVLTLLQALFTYAPPLQYLFGTEAMDLSHWVRTVLFGAALFTLVEAEKALLRPRVRRSSV